MSTFPMGWTQPIPHRLNSLPRVTFLSNLEPPHGNYTPQVNRKFSETVKQLPDDRVHENLRRVGTIGVKLGMTTLWDSWGEMVPVTIVALDRVQVVHIKESNEEGFKQVQMGSGAPNMKKINKPTLGHFMKARVPPKKHLVEFKVSD